MFFFPISTLDSVFLIKMVYQMHSLKKTHTTLSVQNFLKKKNPDYMPHVVFVCLKKRSHEDDAYYDITV